MDEETRAILEEIAKYTGPRTKEPGEFTLEEYRIEKGRQNGRPLSDSQARRHLKDLIEDGVIEKISGVIVPPSRHPCNVYRKAKG